MRRHQIGHWVARSACIAFVGTAISAPPLIAQQMVYVPIPVGTPIPIVTNKELSSKTAKKGDKLDLTVSGDVVIAGRTVIAQGAPIWGVITEAKKSGRFGSNGALEISIDSVKTVNGTAVLLLPDLHAASAKLVQDKGGKGSAKSSVSGIPGADIATGFFKRGGDIEFAAKAPVPAFTATYVVLQFVDSTASTPIESGSESIESMIALYEGVETWARALGTYAAHLGSTPEIRALGERMVKEHEALQAAGNEFAKKKNMPVPPLVPADQAALSDALAALRGMDDDECDQTLLQRIYGIGQNVINVFDESAPEEAKPMLEKMIAAWKEHMTQASKLMMKKK